MRHHQQQQYQQLGQRWMISKSAKVNRWWGHALLMNVNRNGTTFESIEEKKHIKAYQVGDHVFKFQAVRGGFLPS